MAEELHILTGCHHGVDIYLLRSLIVVGIGQDIHSYKRTKNMVNLRSATRETIELTWRGESP